MTQNPPPDFEIYWKRKSGMAMTLEQCWQKWQAYWPQSYSRYKRGLYKTNDEGSCYVLGRYGDQGLYTVENCRVITHRENTLERNHGKCRNKLKGRVNNPEGGRSVRSSRHGGARIQTPLGQFDNCSEAAKQLKMHRSSVWHRVTSDHWPDWQYVDRPES